MKFLTLLLCALTISCGMEAQQPTADVQFVGALGRQVRKLTYSMRKRVAHADFSGLPWRLRREAMASLYYRDEGVRAMSKSMQRRTQELLGSSGDVVTTPYLKAGHDAGMNMGTKTVYEKGKRLEAGKYLQTVRYLQDNSTPRELRDEKVRIAILTHEFAAEVAMLLRKKQTAHNILLRAVRASESTRGRVRLEIALKGKDNQKIGTLALTDDNVEEITEYLYREVHGFERMLPSQAME